MTAFVFRSQPTRGQLHHTGTPEAFRGMLESLMVLAQTVLSGQLVCEYESKLNAVPMEHIAFPSVASWTAVGFGHNNVKWECNMKQKKESHSTNLRSGRRWASGSAATTHGRQSPGSMRHFHEGRSRNTRR